MPPCNCYMNPCVCDEVLLPCVCSVKPPVFKEIAEGCPWRKPFTHSDGYMCEVDEHSCYKQKCGLWYWRSK